MKYVTFNGGNVDARTLGKDDFAKAGVEVDEDMTFQTGRPVKVKNAVADGLANNRELYGDFTITELSEAEAAEVDAQAKAEAAEAEAQAEAQSAAFPEGGSSGSAQELPAPTTTSGPRTSGRASTP